MVVRLKGVIEVLPRQAKLTQKHEIESCLRAMITMIDSQHPFMPHSRHKEFITEMRLKTSCWCENSEMPGCVSVCRGNPNTWIGEQRKEKSEDN
uniref:Uncharacterized protein n=1 Tax=Bracon brevicornis TaxID=1563983 RepID=A0A6V7M1U6_9HYME